jgi:hypothetical protein
MKNFHIIFIILYTSILFLLVSSKTVYSQEYNALAGLESMKSVIDFRKSKPEEVATYLHYCHETYKGLNSFMETEFVIVFTGPVVKFLCTNNENIPRGTTKVAEKDSK